MSLQESRRELERIRRLRDDGPSGEQETEVLVCPVEGCSRTVVDDPAGLMHHVRESKDGGHRFKRLTEDLELMIDREKYRAMWGPGVGGDDRGEYWSIYEDEDPWGPGIPETEVSGL